MEAHESDKHKLFNDLTARHGKNPQAEAAHFLGRLDRRQQGVLGQRFDDSSDEDMLASAQYLFGSSFDEEGQIWGLATSILLNLFSSVSEAARVS